MKKLYTGLIAIILCGAIVKLKGEAQVTYSDRDRLETMLLASKMVARGCNITNLSGFIKNPPPLVTKLDEKDDGDLKCEAAEQACKEEAADEEVANATRRLFLFAPAFIKSGDEKILEKFKKNVSSVLIEQDRLLYNEVIEGLKKRENIEKLKERILGLSNERLKCIENMHEWGNEEVQKILTHGVTILEKAIVIGLYAAKQYPTDLENLVDMTRNIYSENKINEDEQEIIFSFAGIMSGKVDEDGFRNYEAWLGKGSLRREINQILEIEDIKKKNSFLTNHVKSIGIVAFFALIIGYYYWLQLDTIFVS